MMARHLKGTKQIVSMSLDAELVRRVEDLADAKNVSRSRLIEELIRGGIEQEEMAMKAFSNPVIAQALTRAFASPDMLKLLMKEVTGEVPTQSLQQFHQGMNLISEYAGEFKKSQDAEIAAKRTARKLMKRKGK